jgi:hypothetical protein
VPTPAEVQAKLDHLVPHYASELLLPGRGSKLAGLRPVVEHSVIKLFQTLQTQGVYIRATEHKFDKPASFNVNGVRTEVQVSGSIDVLAADQQAEPVVIDLKWTNRSKYRREEITEGNAMQLALYHWALDDGPDPMSTVAEDAAMSYYMLKQGEFASTSTLFGPALASPASSRGTWQRSVRAAEFSIAEVVGGRVLAAGRTSWARPTSSGTRQRQTAGFTRSRPATSATSPPSAASRGTCHEPRTEQRHHDHGQRRHRKDLQPDGRNRPGNQQRHEAQPDPGHDLHEEGCRRNPSTGPSRTLRP